MTPIIKNMAIVLGLATIAFAGYYIYVNKDGMVLQPGGDSGMAAQTLARSTEFIQYRQELDALSIDATVFEDAHFRSLTSYAEPILEQPVGRANPFVISSGGTSRPAAPTNDTDAN